MERPAGRRLVDLLCVKCVIPLLPRYLLAYKWQSGATISATVSSRLLLHMYLHGGCAGTQNWNREREVAITSVRKPADPNEEILQRLHCVELAKMVYKPPFMVSWDK